MKPHHPTEPEMYKRRTNRKRFHHLQEWERQAIQDAYADDEKVVAVAAEFNVDKKAVVYWARKAGLKPRPMRRAEPDSLG